MSNLPNLIIGGAQKSGTTSLHRLLASHRDIFVPETPQEIHFFDMAHAYRRGSQHLARYFRSWNGQPYLAQTSPLYLYLPCVAKRIYEMLPNAHLVFILRNPIDRAYSHYWHEIKAGWEHVTFEEALAREETRISQGFDAMRHFSYVDRGRYASQLARFERLFPRSQILILRLEDLQLDLHSVLRQLGDFLSINPADFLTPQSESLHSNAARLPRSRLVQRCMRPVKRWFPKVGRAVDRLNLASAPYPPMRPDTRNHLSLVFEDELRELQAMWGVSFRQRAAA